MTGWPHQGDDFFFRDRQADAENRFQAIRPARPGRRSISGSPAGTRRCVNSAGTGLCASSGHFPPWRRGRRHETAGPLGLRASASPGGLGPVCARPQSGVSSSKRNCCGGPFRVRQWHGRDVNEAGRSRFQALEAELATVPLHSHAD